MTDELKAALRHAHTLLGQARSHLQISILDMHDGDDDSYAVTRTDDDVIGGMIDIEGTIERLLRS